MGIFDRLFGKGDLKVPQRHRQAAYMNLAYEKTPTFADATPAAAWDTDPPNPERWVDEKIDSHSLGAHNDNVESWAVIDLGQEYEIYEIVIDHIPTTAGFRQAAGGAAIDFTLQTGVLATIGDATTRDTQSVATDNAWKTVALNYLGEGIPVRYIFIAFTPDGTRICSLDLSSIEVYGC